MLSKSITHSYSSKKNTVTTAKSLRFQRKAERLHRRPAIKHSAENGQQNKVYCFPKEMVFEHSNNNDNLVKHLQFSLNQASYFTTGPIN